MYFHFFKENLGTLVHVIFTFLNIILDIAMQALRFSFQELAHTLRTFSALTFSLKTVTDTIELYKKLT